MEWRTRSLLGLGLLTGLACGDDATSPGAGTADGGTSTGSSSEGTSGDGGSTGTGEASGSRTGSGSGGPDSTGGGSSDTGSVLDSTGTDSETDAGPTDDGDPMTTGDTTGPTGTTSGVGQQCGNGVVEGDEICDDGNAINADGCNIDCRASCTELWEDHTLGEADGLGDALWGLSVDGAGNVVATGRRPTATEGWNIWLVKFSPDGTLLWQQDIDAFGGDDEGHGVATDSGDNIILTGFVEGNGGNPRSGHFLYKLDPDGTILWSDEPEPGPTEGYWSSDVAVGADDQIVAVGTRAEAAGYSIWVRAYDSDGGISWTEQVPQTVAGTDNRAQAVAVDSTGTIYVGGYEWVGGSNSRAWLRQYDAGGTAGWTVTREGSANGLDMYRSLAFAANGDVVAVGLGTIAGEGQSALFDRYDNDGNEVWLSTIGDEGDDGAFDVVVDSDGNIVIAGNNSSDAWLVKYSDAGDEPWWSKSYDNGASFEAFSGVDVDADDNILVGGGYFFGGFDFSLWVAKFTP
ncbi:MAG: hypothetical protein AAF721_14820 [Myxococcota bacterium]